MADGALSLGVSGTDLGLAGTVRTVATRCCIPRCHFPRRSGLFLLLSLLLVTGCSRPKDMPDLGRVSGRVTIDGQPLAGVIISFMPDKGRAAAATTDSEGRYDLVYLNDYKGCKIGPNTIGFFVPTGGSPSHPIPAKYQNKSDIKVDVKAEANTFDFDLKSDSVPPKPPRKTGPVLD